MVNHPPHYTDGKYECLEVMEDVFGKDAVADFCICNAFKYVWRCRKKHDTPVEDLKKAVFYANRAVQEIEGDNDQITFDDLSVGTVPQVG